MRTPEQRKIDETDMAWVRGLIEAAQQRAFFGTVVLKFEDGRLKRAVREESLLPPTVAFKT